MSIELDKSCIICLETCQEVDNDFILIYDCDEQNISIEKKILKCFPNYGELRPEKICPACLDDLNAAYRFYNNCEQSSTLLKNCLVQEDDIKESIIFEQVQTNEGETHFIEETQHQEKVAINEKNQTEEFERDEADIDDLSEREHIEYIEEQLDESCQNQELVKVKNEKTQIVKRFKSKTKQSTNLNFQISKTNKNEQTKGKNTPKICELCGNSYKYQHALKAHMRRHLNDRPFNCEFCEKKFVSNVELRRHIRVHTGAKPYVCSYCDRRFSDYGSRIKHERTHTGERPFVCNTCNKSFAYAHVLSVHLRTHTGEKKFKCTECERGFTKKAYMIAHMEQHKRSAVIAAKEDEINNIMYLKKDLSTNSNEAQENSEESLEDCITAYIVEELTEENNEQLETLDNICEEVEQTEGKKRNQFIIKRQHSQKY